MEKTTLEAKGEIEGFFIKKVNDFGIKNMKMNEILGIEDNSKK